MKRCPSSPPAAHFAVSIQRYSDGPASMSHAIRPARPRRRSLPGKIPRRAAVWLSVTMMIAAQTGALALSMSASAPYLRWIEICTGFGIRSVAVTADGLPATAETDEKDAVARPLCGLCTGFSAIDPIDATPNGFDRPVRTASPAPPGRGGSPDGHRAASNPHRPRAPPA